MQRNKGKRFERDIADRIRKLFPSAVVRRASQAERADNPDVFVERHADDDRTLLDRLWLELQDAQHPTPTAKLTQAECDVLVWQHRRGLDVDRVHARLPVVVWHRIRERETWATMRLATLDNMTGYRLPATVGREIVTMTFDAFMRIVEGAS
jgi:hypothetical protein